MFYNLLIGIAETIIMILIILIFVQFLWIYNISMDLKELDKNLSRCLKDLENNGVRISNCINEINNKSKPHISYAYLLHEIDISLISKNLNKYNNSITRLDSDLDLLYNELKLQSNNPDNYKLYNNLKEYKIEYSNILSNYIVISNKLNFKLSTFPTSILGRILKIHMVEEIE